MSGFRTPGTRHLTVGQRATIAVEIKPELEREAKKRQQEHGGTAPGQGKNTSRRTMGSDNKHERESSTLAANKLGISRDTVGRTEPEKVYNRNS